MIGLYIMLPIFYSFRRCPYAIRARLALAYSQQRVELREITLKNKPSSLLTFSPKGTVPVLVLPDSTVLEESLDIMHWCLTKNDPEDWLTQGDDKRITKSQSLIIKNDTVFKAYLDRYKYADRYPEHSMTFYRDQVGLFLNELNQHLNHSTYLTGDTLTLADIAIIPFIRQCASVDVKWFNSTPYKSLQSWLDSLLNSSLFLSVMNKYAPWKKGDNLLLFPE